MSKETTKTNDAVIEKIKADEEAKKEALRIAAQQDAMDAEAAKLDDETAAALKAEADKKAAEIEASERDEGDVLIDEPKAPSDEMRRTKSRTAADKLRLIAMDYPRTTPDEHVVFGRGGIRYTLGDLRDLVNIR